MHRVRDDAKRKVAEEVDPQDVNVTYSMDGPRKARRRICSRSCDRRGCSTIERSPSCRARAIPTGREMIQALIDEGVCDDALA